MTESLSVAMLHGKLQHFGAQPSISVETEKIIAVLRSDHQIQERTGDRAQELSLRDELT